MGSDPGRGRARQRELDLILGFTLGVQLSLVINISEGAEKYKRIKTMINFFAASGKYAERD